MKNKKKHKGGIKMINKKEVKIDDIELYEFFKGFSCEHFDIEYDHNNHCWNICFEYRSDNISREDLIKLESQLKELSLKYLNKPEKRIVMEYKSEEN